jgi:hypothetical protein
MGPKGQWSKVQTDKGELTALFPDGSMTPAGEWEFDAACGHAAVICFGELPPIAKVISQQEFCFDDDPADMDALAEMD